MKKFLYVLFYPIILIYKFCFKLKVKHFFCEVTIEKIDTLSGRDFEELVELIFKFSGYKTKLTKASSDYGADVIATKNGVTVAVQTKLYYNHQVGNSAVQEVNSALKYYNANFACVVTNWKFSAQAKNLAKVENVVLLDRTDLINFLTCVQNGEKEKVFCGLVKQFKINA